MSERNDYKIDARFAFGPRHLHFHANELDETTKILIEAMGGSSSEKIRELFSNFPHLHNFQHTIADITRRDPYDLKVQEAYWIGNSLLKQCSSDDNVKKILIGHYHSSKLPFEYMSKLREGIEGGPVFLHHNYQVSHIAVIDSGGLENSMQAVNNCMIWSAKVRELADGKAVVDTYRLICNQVGFELKPETIEVKANPKLVSNLEVGKNVALHWGSIVMQITNKQDSQLKYWTNEVIKKL